MTIEVIFKFVPLWNIEVQEYYLHFGCHHFWTKGQKHLKPWRPVFWINILIEVKTLSTFVGPFMNMEPWGDSVVNHLQIDDSRYIHMCPTMEYWCARILHSRKPLLRLSILQSWTQGQRYLDSLRLNQFFYCKSIRFP